MVDIVSSNRLNLKFFCSKAFSNNVRMQGHVLEVVEQVEEEGDNIEVKNHKGEKVYHNTCSPLVELFLPW
jgi:hypothetical protein